MSKGQTRLGASGVRHLRIPALTGADGHVPMKMSRWFLYIFIGILAVAFCVLVFLHHCVSLPQTPHRPSSTAHSAQQAGNLTGIGEHTNGAISDSDRFSGVVSFAASVAYPGDSR